MARKSQPATRHRGIVAIEMPEIKEQVRAAARKNQMTMSAYVRFVLIQTLNAQSATRKNRTRIAAR